jgi:hypothetical protein
LPVGLQARSKVANLRGVYEYGFLPYKRLARRFATPQR